MIAIEFLNVSKSYRMDRERRRSFQEIFTSLTRRKRVPSIPSRQDDNLFWSLRDVSVTVARGETVGIVGANGAGKSTALKLISRIVLPTHGKLNVNGRVTALLELGAGFHPELSGRDNIYLNGTVMGLSRKSINYKVDQIIDFAEVGDFIDVPVKDYSSGMFARLGFSVAVHLDPEIVLLDEVLSVGDQSFQQKCNERMLRMRKQGVTTVFVSHSIDAVWRICSRAVWLDKGQVRMEGPAHKVVDAYYKFMLEKDSDDAGDTDPEEWLEGHTGSGEVRVTDVEFLGEELKPRRIFMTHESMIVRIHYRAQQAIEKPLFGLMFLRAESELNLAGPNNGLNGFVIPHIFGKGYVDYRIAQLPFLPGDYALTTTIYDKDEVHPFDVWHKGARFVVVPGGTPERYGYVALQGAWQHQANAAIPETPSQPQPKPMPEHVA
jgi:lipopolysaccharide transport system ATP-binding protein